MKTIGVVGAGTVGSIFKDFDGYEVVHRNEWKDKIRGWSGVINCAGIAGLQVCEDNHFSQVLRANVKLPIEIADYATLLKIPSVHLSSSIIYRRPSPNGPVCEDAPLFAYNNYASSKILMEATLPKNCYIFRIPAVSTGSGMDNDLEQRVKGWASVEDVMISIVYGHTIAKAVNRVMQTKQVKPGIYNVASEIVHLPTHVKGRYGWEGEIIPAHALNRSPAIQLDTTKAERAELI